MLAFADDLGGTVAGLNIAEGFRTTPIESKSNIFHACPPGRLTRGADWWPPIGWLKSS